MSEDGYVHSFDSPVLIFEMSFLTILTLAFPFFNSRNATRGRSTWSSTSIATLTSGQHRPSSTQCGIRLDQWLSSGG